MNKAEAITGINLTHWEVNNPADKDQYYNCDAVIEAYLKGEKDGLKNEQKVIFNQFTQNVDKSKEYTIRVLKVVEEQGFTPLAAYIRFPSFDIFECVIPVKSSDFINDKFLSIYNSVSEIQSSIKSDVFSIDFSFIPVDEESPEDNIHQDGFIIRFKKS